MTNALAYTDTINKLPRRTAQKAHDASRFCNDTDLWSYSMKTIYAVNYQYHSTPRSRRNTLSRRRVNVYLPRKRCDMPSCAYLSLILTR